MQLINPYSNGAGTGWLCSKIHKLCKSGSTWPFTYFIAKGRTVPEYHLQWSTIKLVSRRLTISSNSWEDVSKMHILLSKLQHYGIRGNVLNWISDFLLLRTQRVVCGSSSSKPIDVISGVPQRSVPGPLLFLAYINDISDNLLSIHHHAVDLQTTASCIETLNQLKMLEFFKKIWTNLPSGQRLGACSLT